MKKRVISGIVMIAIVAPLVYMGGAFFNIAMALAATYAYKEIINLPEFKNLPLFIKVFGSLFYLLVALSSLLNTDSSVINVAYILSLFLFYTVPTLFYEKVKYTIKDATILFGYSVFIALGFSALISARMDSLGIFLYLLSIPVISDTLALVTGSLIGKNKLLPKVSPKKTVEGAIGGFICGSLVALIIYQYLVGDINAIVLIMTALLGIFSQIGDLLFSKIKRENNIKDFSNLIPGHGGVLDRLDSLLLVSIIYLIFISIM